MTDGVPSGWIVLSLLHCLRIHRSPAVRSTELSSNEASLPFGFVDAGTYKPLLPLLVHKTNKLGQGW
jgi:hypothetical protein